MLRKLGLFLFVLLCASSSTRWIIHAQTAPPETDYFVYASYPFHTLYHPTGLALSGSTLFISDSSNHVIRQFSGGSLTTVAGGINSPGYVDGPLSSARFYRPTGLLVENSSWQEQVPCDSGDITPTIGGDPPPCFPTTRIHIYTKVYVADTQNYVVRLICLGD